MRQYLIDWCIKEEDEAMIVNRELKVSPIMELGNPVGILRISMGR